MKDMQVIVRTF